MQVFDHDGADNARERAGGSVRSCPADGGAVKSDDEQGDSDRPDGGLPDAESDSEEYAAEGQAEGEDDGKDESLFQNFLYDFHKYSPQSFFPLYTLGRILST